MTNKCALSRPRGYSNYIIPGQSVLSQSWRFYVNRDTRGVFAKQRFHWLKNHGKARENLLARDQCHDTLKNRPASIRPFGHCYTGPAQHHKMLRANKRKVKATCKKQTKSMPFASQKLKASFFF